MAAFRAAGLTYLQYSLIAARALRSVLKEEAKAAALRREGTSTVKFSKWEAGKQQTAKPLEAAN